MTTQTLPTRTAPVARTAADQVPARRRRPSVGRQVRVALVIGSRAVLLGVLLAAVLGPTWVWLAGVVVALEELGRS